MNTTKKNNVKNLDPTVRDSESNRFEKPGEYFDGYANEWDEMYTPKNASRAHDYVQRESKLLNWVETTLTSPKNVLEFGCGAGHCAAAVSEKGHNMTALDVSSEMIEATRRRFASRNLSATFVVGQVQDLITEHSGKFDLIYALGVMDYIEELRDTFDAIAKLLAPGGRFILSFTNDKTPFRQVEMPLKRGLAQALYATTRKDKYRDVAKQSSRSHSLTEIERIVAEHSDLNACGVEYFSYGVRMGGAWFPPFSIVRKSDKVYQSAGATDWGRGFLFFGERPASNDLTIQNVELNALDTVARIHEETFADSMGVSLGPVYVRQLLQWFACANDTTFLVAKKDTQVVGYVFGVFLDAQAAMNQDLLLAAGFGMLRNPAVLMGGPFRKELGRRVKILMGQSPKTKNHEELQKALQQPTFSLVGIGVCSDARGHGIAGQLMTQFEQKAQVAGAKSLRLSVYKSNAAARKAYEKQGYVSFDHPDNPEILYYGKNFGEENADE